MPTSIASEPCNSLVARKTPSFSRRWFDRQMGRIIPQSNQCVARRRIRSFWIPIEQFDAPLSSCGSDPIRRRDSSPAVALREHGDNGPSCFHPAAFDTACTSYALILFS
jgi:hypothetical protein